MWLLSSCAIEQEASFQFQAFERPLFHNIAVEHFGL